jgi:heptaprenyl diphosphate synthase
MTPQPWTAQPGKTPRPGNRRTLAILGAFCLFLSTIEYLIPKPLPFMRIGLANLPLLLALDILPLGELALLALIKVVGQGIVTGTLFSYILLFSLAGTFVSALSMFALRRLLGTRLASMAGISVLGALLSNGAQLALARLFVFGPSVRYLAPPFLAMGVISGTGLGLFCERFMGKSRWYKREISPGAAEDTVLEGPGSTTANTADRGGGKWGAFRRKRREWCERSLSARDLCLAGLLMMPALVFNPYPYARFLQFLFFSLLVWLAGKKNNPLIAIVVILGIVAFNLLTPYGQALFSIGTFRFTLGALEGGLKRAATLEGLIMLSRFAIRRDLRLPGAFGGLIGESFRILASIQERRNAVSGKNFAAGIDALLLDLSKTGEPPPVASEGAPGSSALGRIILAATTLLAWLPWILGWGR